MLPLKSHVTHCGKLSLSSDVGICKSDDSSCLRTAHSDFIIPLESPFCSLYMYSYTIYRSGRWSAPIPQQFLQTISEIERHLLRVHLSFLYLHTEDFPWRPRRPLGRVSIPSTIGAVHVCNTVFFLNSPISGVEEQELMSTPLLDWYPTYSSLQYSVY